MLLALRFALLSIILLVVDAEDAFRGDPLFALGGDKFSYSVPSDKFEVFDFAHAVFCPVTFIQALEPFAGKLRTMAAVLPGALGADAQAAMRAGFWPFFFKVSAAVAGIPWSQVRSTDAAVHPAWCDQVLGDGFTHA